MPIISALGAPRSVNQVPSAGVAAEQFDLEVAPGRHDVRPRLSLLYSSLGALADSGLGWSLTPGKIERSTTKGVPRLDATDTFTFTLNSSATELADVGGGKFREKTESDYREFTFDGTSWQMRLPQGVVYRFGATTDSKVGASSWLISGIQDPNGNTIRYVYTQDQGTAYLAEIDYTGDAATGDLGANKVLFTYEARSDVRVSYSLAERRTRAMRLKSVSVLAGTALARRFDLTYEPSATNGVSLLTGITLTGSDGTSAVAARTYQYGSRTLGWRADVSGAVPFAFYDGSGKDLGVRTADVNGDDRVDLVRNGSEVWLGDGTGSFAKDDGWSASLAAIGATFVTGEGLDQGVRIVDINGDFRPDVVIASPTRKQVYLNNGSGWALDPTYTNAVAGLTEDVGVPLGTLNPDADCQDGGCDVLIPDPIPFSFIDTSNDSRGVFLSDVNGDGLPDIVWSYRDTKQLQNFVTDAGVINRTPLFLRAVYLNTGTGFVRDTARSNSLTNPLLDPFVDDTQLQGYDLVDANGDGLPDIVRTLQGATPVVLLNNGDGWDLDAAFSASLAANPQILSYSSDFKNLGLTTFDLDGDGLPDFIRADSGTRAAFRNTGRGWVADAGLTAPHRSGGPAPRRWVQRLDGRDLRRRRRRQRPGPAAHTERQRGSASASRPRGSSTCSRTPSAAWVKRPISRTCPRAPSTTSGPTVSRTCPWCCPCARASRAVTAGVTRSSIPSRTPARRWWRRRVPRLRDFERRHRFAAATRLRSVFSQTGPTSGSLLRTETYDAANTLRARHSLTYATPSPVAGVDPVEVTQTDEELFDGSASVHTRVRTSYDAFLEHRGGRQGR